MTPDFFNRSAVSKSIIPWAPIELEATDLHDHVYIKELT
jgi:hypothetical protein